ncbi:putative receptor protein kinase ZmPK1 [Prunus yedoensis var. nudiflora]|uniref:Putative receptor protein kinase ZmPK1 n=1 Tax=Prunus yedoensis var. nudiflora TaxID=2094558 RepID=A0A314UIC3_PRUYE|nr:putative receptor protein kinase ZmPK1 [Prunus yedoensis var. nudiflora]
MSLTLGAGQSVRLDLEAKKEEKFWKLKSPLDLFSLQSSVNSWLKLEAELAKTQNSLERGSSLSLEDDFLTSLDKSFTSEFYGVGTKAYWFSVWFTNSKNKTLVWMANRDRPVNALGSRVSLSRDGTMILTDVDGTIAWESNTNSTPTGAERAELLNSGNLVLKDPQGKILWQSFEFPTDTLLPNEPCTKSMKVTSSLGRGNFGTGYYSFYFDNDNVLRLIYDGPEMSSLLAYTD